MRHYWCSSPFFSDIDYKLESDYDDDMPKYELSFGVPESVTAIHTEIDGIKLQLGDDFCFYHINAESGDSLNDLLVRLYYFHPENMFSTEKDYDRLNIMWFPLDCIDSDGGSKVFILDDPDYYMKKTPEKNCTLLRTYFTWHQDSRSNHKWILTREPGCNGDDFLINIDILIIYYGETILEHHTVRYKDLCRAVAGGCTELLKKQGFIGYRKTAMQPDISLSHLIFLKAVALDRMDKIQRIDKYYGNSAATDFYKELELLLADC